MRAASEVAEGNRPIQGFESESSSPRTFWTGAKTNSGTIVAGDYGLIEFDRGRWSQLSAEGRFNWQSLAVDSAGRVWVAAQGELGVYEPDHDGVLHYRSLNSLLPESERDIGDVWNVLFDARGQTICVGAGRVVRTDGLSAESWALPSTRQLYGWNDFGEVLIGGAEGCIFVMTASGPRPFKTPPGYSAKEVAWTENLDRDGWFALTDAGLISADAAANGRFDSLNRLLGRSAVIRGVRTRDGRLAISTYYNGLVVVDTETGEFDHISEANGLLSACVGGIFPGEGDWLWAVTNRGVSRVSISKAVSLIPNGSGVDGALIRFVEATGNSAVVSTQSGRFEIPLNGAPGQPNKLSHLWFQGQARFGSKMLGGTMHGLHEVTHGKVRRVCPETEDVVSVVVPRSGGNLAFYSVGSKLRAVRERDGAYEILATEGLGAEIETVVEDAVGDLWVASAATVTRLSFSESEDHFVIRKSFPITHEGGDSRRATKLFCSGGVVFLLRDGVLLGLDRSNSAFEPISDFQDVEFVDVTRSAGAEAWALARPASHRNDSPRLVRLEYREGTLAAEVIEVSGLLSSGALRNIHAVEFESESAEIWIGTDGGIVRLNPSLVETAGPLPRLEISTTRSEGGTSSRVSVAVREFSSGPGFLAFGWSTPGLVPGDLLVQTRIAGAEDGWVSAGNRSEREFTGLGDGSYEFQVRAVDALGRPGPVTSRAFTVLPPWYRTPWAVSGFCVAALLIGAVSWQLRIRVARRRAEELEELVDTRTRELAQVNAEMTRFIARMNHEIRNPLNGLLGAVGVLEQFEHPGREGRMIQILRACADHLGAVVEDVLDFSNIEGGRIVVQDRAFPIAEMLEAVPRMMLAESERTGTEVVTTIAPDVPQVVMADPDRIRQILVNFLSNALKFAPGEPVHVEVTTATVDDSPWLRFAVRDHGPGISEADKQSLFMMFERGRNPAKRRVRGMGIGLATCRLLARRMGGEVGVISGLGEGSEFYLRLPLRVEAGVASAPAAEPRADLRGLACLIVEDQDFNRVILRDMLERVGCTVDEATDAETALKLAAMNRYEIVFTDLALPDAAPGEILKMLKDQQSSASTPVPALVVTTAYATENVRQTCLAAGATAFLAKPLAAAKVLAVLREIDSARRPAASVVAPAHEPAKGAAQGVIVHLARIRGCDVASMAVEIAGNIDDEVLALRAGALSDDSREVAHRAHRLLSLSALADVPELAGVAAGIQGEARDGRLPAASRLAVLAEAAALARKKLGSITSAGAPGAQSRAQGHSESAASNHSD